MGAVDVKASAAPFLVSNHGTYKGWEKGGHGGYGRTEEKTEEKKEDIDIYPDPASHDALRSGCYAVSYGQ